MTLINPPKQVCGAKTRQGGSCREVPSEGKKRCRLHGGAKGSGALLASATAGSDTGGTARRCERNASLRPPNGKKRFQPGTGTLPAPHRAERCEMGTKETRPEKPEASDLPIRRGGRLSIMAEYCITLSKTDYADDLRCAQPTRKSL